MRAEIIKNGKAFDIYIYNDDGECVDIIEVEKLCFVVKNSVTQKEERKDENS